MVWVATTEAEDHNSSSRGKSDAINNLTNGNSLRSCKLENEPAQATVDLRISSPKSNAGSSSDIGSALLPSCLRIGATNSNPPALVRLPAIQTARLHPKTESISDGDLSDFSLNDTEEDEEEFRSCMLSSGSQGDGEC